MKIPKVYSAPADPTALSLLKLPGEIRTKINKLVFVQPSPISVHNADFYYNRRPKKPKPVPELEIDSEEELGSTHMSIRKARHYFRSRRSAKSPSNEIQPVQKKKRYPGCYEEEYARYCEYRLKWEKRHTDDLEKAREFVHYYSLGLGLLLSCRQLYHEAVGILYGDNIFIVSRVLSRHNHDDLIQGNSANAYHQFNYAPLWLRKLGTQTGMIRKVIIDASAICKPRFILDQRVELLPLLRILWAAEWTGCEITFAGTGRRHESSACQRWDHVDPYIGHLNKCIAKIGKADALGLRHLSQSILLDSVLIGRYAGCVKYYPSPRTKTRNFTILEDSESIKWVPEQNELLGRLWGEPLGLICRYAATTQDVVTFHLGNRTIEGFDQSIFNASRRLRNHFVPAFAEFVPINLVLESTKPTTDFDNFKSLRSLYRRSKNNLPYHLHSRIIQQSQRAQMLTSNDVCTLKLNFCLAKPSTLSKVRIKLNALLSIICNPTLDGMTGTFSIKIQLEYEKENGVRYKNSENSMRDIEMCIFLYFTDLLYHLAQDKLPVQPEIWMDGHGRLYQKSSSNTVVLPLKTYYKKFGFGGRKLTRLLEAVETRYDAEDSSHQSWEHQRDQCMYCAWKVIRAWAGQHKPGIWVAKQVASVHGWHDRPHVYWGLGYKNQIV